MKKRGFTLAELLGVVALLALICLIAFPPILNAIKKSKKTIENTTETIIFQTAEIYIGKHSSNFDKIEDSKYCIQLQSLIDEEGLSMDLKDPNTNQRINPLKYVKITVKGNKYNYSMAKEGEC